MGIQGWFQGYKTYLVLIAYCIFVVSTGRVPEGAMGSEDTVLGLDYGSIKELLATAVAATLKAKWNRVTAGS